MIQVPVGQVSGMILSEDSVTEHVDTSHGMRRVEVTCKVL